MHEAQPAAQDRQAAKEILQIKPILQPEQVDALLTELMHVLQATLHGSQFTVRTYK